MNQNKTISVKTTLIIATLMLVISCSKESDETSGGIKGSVTFEDQGSDVIIHPAFIFFKDTLLAVTDENGKYSIPSLKTGKYSLTCSALDYSNLNQEVNVVGGTITTHDFSLKPDNNTGFLIGEFQDLTAFNDSINNNPELAGWDEKQVYDAATGATIQSKWFPGLKGNRVVYLGNDSIGFSDAFGQYGFSIQCGTYSFTGTCQGYKSKTYIVTILPDTKTYLNFKLERN